MAKKYSLSTKQNQKIANRTGMTGWSSEAAESVEMTEKEGNGMTELPETA